MKTPERWAAGEGVKRVSYPPSKLIVCYGKWDENGLVYWLKSLG